MGIKTNALKRQTGIFLTGQIIDRDLCLAGPYNCWVKEIKHDICDKSFLQKGNF